MRFAEGERPDPTDTFPLNSEAVKAVAIYEPLMDPVERIVKLHFGIKQYLQKVAPDALPTQLEFGTLTLVEAITQARFKPEESDQIWQNAIEKLRQVPKF